MIEVKIGRAQRDGYTATADVKYRRYGGEWHPCGELTTVYAPTNGSRTVQFYSYRDEVTVETTAVIPGVGAISTRRDLITRLGRRLESPDYRRAVCPQ